MDPSDTQLTVQTGREGGENAVSLWSLLLPSSLFKEERVEEFYYGVYWIMTFCGLYFYCV